MATGSRTSGLMRLNGMSHLERLRFNSDRITDAGLVALDGMTELEELSIHCRGVTDLGLTHCAGMNRLRSLDLRSTQVTDAGLAASTERWRSSDTLILAHTRITDATLETLKARTGILHLDLGNTSISDAGLVQLGPLKALRSLDLSFTKIHDHGLRHLKGLDGTRSGLNLANCREVTDAGLVHFRGLTRLRCLRVNGTQLTGTGLAAVEGMKVLLDLDVRSTAVTMAGVDQLQKKLPKARIQASSENARPDVREGELPGIVKVGDSEPAFKLTTLDGKPLSLADYRGKYLLVFFWATWCAPCKAEMPRLRTTYNTFGHDPSFAMLGLSLDEGRDAPLKYASEHNLPWASGVSRTGPGLVRGRRVCRGRTPVHLADRPRRQTACQGLAGRGDRCCLDGCHPQQVRMPFGQWPRTPKAVFLGIAEKPGRSGRGTGFPTCRCRH